MKFLLGKKIEMTQVFDQQGNVIPVTLVAAGPVTVLQKKTKDIDGYEATQVGFEKLEKKTKIKKTMKGKEFRHLKETRGSFEKNVGDQIGVTDFAEGDMVTVIATSKGKGFQGAVKRHGFAGRNKMHGMKHDERTTGSIGQRFPQHTIKGRRMPGRMGSDRVTVKGLKIIKIDAEKNVVAIKGAVPGRRGTLVEIRAV